MKFVSENYSFVEYRMIEYEIVDKEYGIGCILMKCMVMMIKM